MFVDGFASHFATLWDQTLIPLVSDSYSVISQLERNVKQLMFTSTTETVARKVIFFITDNQLSGKLEIAIQALHNLTKVYYSFLNVAPIAPIPRGITPDSRYDLQLMPYAILTKDQETMKKYYTVISENIAGLIEHILSLKVILKEVHQSNSLNESSFDESRGQYLQRTRLIDKYASLFHTDIVLKSVDILDTKISDLRTLNASLASECATTLANIVAQESLASSVRADTDKNLVEFNRLAQDYLRHLHVDKSSLSTPSVDQRSRQAFAATAHSLGELQSNADVLRHNWMSLETVVKSVWRRILQEDLLKNFYLSLYNDVTNLVNNPQRADIFTTIFTHVTMRSPGAWTASGDVTSAHDYFALMNADVPVLNVEGKLSDVTDEFYRFTQQTDAVAVLAGKDWRLSEAFSVFKKNLDTFQSQCRPSADVIRCVFTFI